MDLRRKVVNAIQRGESLTAVAGRFEISAKTAGRWRDRQAADRLQPQRSGPQGGIKLTASDDAVLREAIAKRPGLTLGELSQLLGVKVALSTVWRRLAKLGITLKKSR
jgi:transposase